MREVRAVGVVDGVEVEGEDESSGIPWLGQLVDHGIRSCRSTRRADLGGVAFNMLVKYPDEMA